MPETTALILILKGTFAWFKIFCYFINCTIHQNTTAGDYSFDNSFQSIEQLGKKKKHKDQQ